jgi:hypothetical protein
MDPPTSLLGVPLRARRVPVQGITLRVVEAGPEEGPLGVLLHGFPEFGYGWRKQIPALASAGYRVWVPDQRGYEGSEKPPDVAEYRLEALALDVLGIMGRGGGAGRRGGGAPGEGSWPGGWASPTRLVWSAWSF